MELRVLRYFLAVAREENITKAAALLHVTQPTLSRQLRQLEEELGVKLFRRSQYRVVLTDDGMLLRRRAQEIVELAAPRYGSDGRDRYRLWRIRGHDLSLGTHSCVPQAAPSSAVPYLQRQRRRCEGAH